MRLPSIVAAVAFAAARVGASVSGVVMGPDGAPLENVRVAAFRPLPQMLAFRVVTRDRQPSALTTALTDKNGRFALEIAGAGLVDVHAAADGFAPADAIVAADDTAVAIALRRAPMVAGTITANGKPVASAFVLTLPAEAGMPAVATTDADGHYRLPDPKVWARMIVVQHPDFSLVAHDASALDFALEAGQTIRGKVVDEKGRPVADAAVDFQGILMARSAADGTFTMAHAPKPLGALRARGEKSLGTTQFTSGSPVITLTSASSQISGVVRDAGNRPLAGITLFAMSESGDIVVTDANGAFTFQALERGKYQIAADGGSIYSIENATADTSGGDAKVTLVARRIPAIEGIVRDHEGKPVTGAAIFMLMDSGGSFMGGSVPMPTSAVTAADGRFRLQEEIEASMKVRLAAVKPGLPPAISEPLPASRSSRVELTIPLGIEIAGSVVGSDGQPLAGVTINPALGMAPRRPANDATGWATTDDHGKFSGRLTSATKTLTFTRKGYIGAQQLVDVVPGIKPLLVKLAAGASVRGRVVKKDGSPAAEVFIATAEKVTNSGADGSFVLDELEPGPVELRYGSGLGMQVKSVNAPADDVKLVLPGSRKITGRVTDAASGEAVRKFTVAVAESAEESFAMPEPFDASSGDFTVDAPEGSVILTVTADEYAPAKGIAVDAKSSEPVAIKLSRGRALRGRVVDQKGEPIQGVAIGRGESYTLDDREPLQTLADGTFELRGLPFDEETVVSFGKSGFVTQEQKVRAGRDDVTVEVTLLKGITVTGRVIDRAGTPAGGVRVQVSSAAHGATNTAAQTDDSGAFRVEGLALARYDFSVDTTPSGERGELKDVDVAKTRELTIRLEKAATATIFGRVTGLGTKDMGLSMQPFVTVNVAEGDTQTAAVDAGGNYRIENAPAGVVEVQARSGGRRGWRSSAKSTVELRVGSETRVDLAFAEQVTVRGHVTRGGAPLGGVTVSWDGESNSSALTGADGAYEAAVDPGEYDVSLTVNSKPLPFAKHIVVQRSSEIELRVDPTTVSVSVFDADTGTPLAGATVQASPPGETHELATAVTGADGIAALDVQQGTAVTLVASKRGYANASENVTARSGVAASLRLQRTPGVVVRIVDLRDGRTLSGYVIARDAAGRVVASTYQTDPDGTVTLPLAAGAYRISASADGYGSHTVNASVPSGEVRVPLPRGGNLSIRSTRALHGSARLIQPDGEEYVRCWCSGIAEIKLNGPITLVDRISPGAYVLDVALAGEKARRIPVSVIEGQTVTVPIE